MKRLFEALQDRYPGARVADAKFTVRPAEAAGQAIDMLDENLARAVKGARQIDVADLQTDLQAGAL